ncbi:MAG: bifunctional glutamate N-acetyltransferase/amino-acid acetyltransferase ArgJ [Thiomargarita sp.]|nr:bifunctional glutamate N-acetyltransferase/amino-acid acetyltransferase ArgJ [Thiomargarita sp.]
MTKKIYPIAGIEIGTACAGIKQTAKDDLTLFKLATTSHCAAVFTRNAFCAAPVTLAKQHLQLAEPQLLIINSGNANMGTGKQGLKNAIFCCEEVARLANCATNQVLPFSTGVIGEQLPVSKITAAISTAIKAFKPENWTKAAHAIMTTDTVPKIASKQFILDGNPVTITGIAKGAGMIRPNMATMLAFIATDATISKDLLQNMLEQAVNQSFNRITIDGDTSTNDACVLVATGQGKLKIEDKQNVNFQTFLSALTAICLQLAQELVRDGEGATKLMTISIEQGNSEQECLDVAYTIAHSPLVKTAFFASDANWGRILAAVGRSGVTDLDIATVQIYLDELCIIENGGVAENYTDKQGQAVMQQAEILIRVLLGRGDFQTKIYTCDLSYDYIRINAEYRT